jgi:hypothetical protein
MELSKDVIMNNGLEIPYTNPYAKNVNSYVLVIKQRYWKKRRCAYPVLKMYRKTTYK